MLKAGIIGIGNVGQHMARKLAARSDVSLSAVCDVVKKRAEESAKQYGAAAFTDYRKMVETPLDVVFVNTNNAWHAECIIAAAEAGVKNIYCEKPLALTMEEAVRIAEAERRHRLRTSMGFGGRKEYLYVRLNEIIRSGQIGNLLSLNKVHSRGYGFYGREKDLSPGVREHHAAVEHPEISGGWAIHHACHTVFWFTLMGGAPLSVYGRTLKSCSEAPSEEVVWGMLNFQGGAVGVLGDSIGSFRGTRIGVIGTRGTIQVVDNCGFDSSAPVEMRLHLEGSANVHIEQLHRRLEEEDLVAEFIQAILNDEPSPVTFEQGKENLRICLALRESARTGKVIALTEPGK